jgi:hypothetical protein
MKQILITNHLYKRLKTIADEQDESIQVLHPPSPGTGASSSIDGRGWLGNAGDLALAAAADVFYRGQTRPSLLVTPYERGKNKRG